MSKNTINIIDLTADASSDEHSHTIDLTESEEYSVTPMNDDNPLVPSTSSPPPNFEKPIPACGFTPRRDAKSNKFFLNGITAEEYMVHINPATIPTLDSPDSGCLHDISGYISSEVLSDSSYRWSPCGNHTTKTCAFLEITGSNYSPSHGFHKKKYHCMGARACPLVPVQYRTKTHSHAGQVEDQRQHFHIADVDETIAVRQKLRSIYLQCSVKGRPFCNFQYAKKLNNKTVIIQCNGTPGLYRNKSSQHWFISCSKWYMNKNDGMPGSRHSSKNLHMFSDDDIDILRTMFLTGNHDIGGELCDYIAPKGVKRNAKCPVHDLELIPCQEKTCSALMFLVDPLLASEKPKFTNSQNEESYIGNIQNTDSCIANTGNNDSSISKLYIETSKPASHHKRVFAFCVNAHNHPCPPQPRKTVKKSKLLTQIAMRNPRESRAEIELRAQQTLHERSKHPSLVSLKLDKRVLNKQKSSRNTINEYASIFAMLSSPAYPYVRMHEVANNGNTLLLAHNDMLSFAYKSGVFAADCTYRDIQNGSEGQPQAKWYLFNIIAPHSVNTSNSSCVVVSRVILSSLTEESYAAAWKMFFRSMRKQKASDTGCTERDIALDVTYSPLEPGRIRNAIPIRSITTDFESALVHGLGEALCHERGGCSDLHIKGVMIGCAVHFQRSYFRRCLRHRSKEESNAFSTYCRNLSNCHDKTTAKAILDSMSIIDDDYTRWVKRKEFLPMICPAFSTMKRKHRSLALQDTNGVESINRCTHIFSNVRKQPSDTIAKLGDVDAIRIRIAIQSSKGIVMPFARPRKRATSMLAPVIKSTAQNQTKLKTRIRKNHSKPKPYSRRSSQDQMTETKTTSQGNHLNKVKTMIVNNWEQCISNGSPAQMEWESVLQLICGSKTITDIKSALIIHQISNSRSKPIVMQVLAFIRSCEHTQNISSTVAI